MTRRKTIKDLERTFIGMAGGISLYREGIDEFLLSHGFPPLLEDIERLKPKLMALGLYEVCRDTAKEAERLVTLGPESDDRAADMLLKASESLMKASGTWDSMASRFRPANDPIA